jgi:hypothetical protein
MKMANAAFMVVDGEELQCGGFDNEGDVCGKRIARSSNQKIEAR